MFSEGWQELCGCSPLLPLFGWLMLKGLMAGDLIPALRRDYAEMNGYNAADGQMAKLPVIITKPILNFMSLLSFSF